MLTEAFLSWCPSPNHHRSSTLTAYSEEQHCMRVTTFELSIDHHFDTGADTEYVVWEGDVERARLPDRPSAVQFANADEAKAFVEATWLMEGGDDAP